MSEEAEKNDEHQTTGETSNEVDGNKIKDADKQSEEHQTNGEAPEEVNGDARKDGNKNKEFMGPAKAKAAAAKQKVTAKKQKAKDKANPPGGHDKTPIPSAPDGYTIRFTFLRAENLPVSDLTTRSADPYLTATLTSPAIQKRHKEDPDMIYRTRTIHKSTTPAWNQQWVVANIPSSGFRLKCRLYDEDARNYDDRLGNATMWVQNIGDGWPGIKEQAYDIKKRMGSKRAYALKGCVAMLSRSMHMNGQLFLSVEVLGESDPPHGRMYTIAPVSWTKHFSPMIGRLAGTKAPEPGKGEKSKTEKYDFQANQLQLQGPVPATLYHRFVEFKPFVKGMFSKAGLRGRILNKALHHQHRQIYNYSSTTKYGSLEPKTEEVSKKILEMVHYDEGGRIFTYVITLDGLMRFTETGKEFGIDLLSKHTMHSDVNIYIACSGEFFVRRLLHPDKPATAPDQKTHPAEDIPGGPPNEGAPKDPKDYELIIDNDSGTYRPNGDLLGDLQKFLCNNFPGLQVIVKECTDKELSKWKDEQRETKKKQGKTLEVVQNSDGEVSSSDEEALDRHTGALRNGKRHRSTKQKAYAVLEDPRGALKEMIPGEQGRTEREQAETKEDIAGEGGSS